MKETNKVHDKETDGVSDVEIQRQQIGYQKSRVRNNIAGVIISATLALGSFGYGMYSSFHAYLDDKYVVLLKESHKLEMRSDSIDERFTGIDKNTAEYRDYLQTSSLRREEIAQLNKKIKQYDHKSNVLIAPFLFAFFFLGYASLGYANCYYNAKDKLRKEEKELEKML